MKTANAALVAYLQNTNDFHMCDLYEVTLFNGTVQRYADYDMDIRLADGRIFLCTGPGFERDKIKLTSDTVIDSTNVDLRIDGTDRIADVPIIQVAKNGGFDDARLTLYRCFMSEPGVVLDVLEMFSGEIETPEGGGLTLQLDVNSLANKLNNSFPIRSYYPTCPFSLYDSACGVNLSDKKVTGTVTAATRKSITTNLTFDEGYYDQGGLEFTGGALNGSSHAIRYSKDGTIELLAEMEAVPAVGDTFTVYPGCSKTPDVCKAKFNNFLRNRATPFVPLKETIVG